MATTRFATRCLAAAAAMAALVAAAPAQKFFGGNGGGGGGGGFGRAMIQRGQSGMSRNQSGNSSRSFNARRFNSQMSPNFQQGSPSGNSSQSSGPSFDASKVRDRFQSGGSPNFGTKSGSSSGPSQNSSGAKGLGDQVKSRLQNATPGSGQGSKLGAGKLPDLGRVRGPIDGNSSGKANLDQRFKDLSGQFNRGSKGDADGKSRGLDSILDRVGAGQGKSPGSSGLTDALRGATGREMHQDSFQQRLKRGGLDKMFGGDLTKRVDWTKQLQFAGQGDVARRLDLKSQLLSGGGWSGSKYKGIVTANYNKNCSQVAYCGPGWYPNRCYYPTWSPWVSWCWNYSCDPYWDPRPWYCRPIYYRPCVQWVYCDYPVWDPLPVGGCGTWVDVAPAASAAVDLQLQAVRFVDPGHPERNEGPRFRVWVHNASTAPITEPFNVVLLAANGEKLDKNLPQAGVTVSAMKPDEVQAIDIRLPAEVNTMGANEQGEAVPFTMLHVVVDSHQQIDETSETNNGQALARTEIDPIDPYVLSSDAKENQVVDGATIILAGEGLGPEPGQVVVHLTTPGREEDKVEVEAEITGWCDQGVQVLLPPLPLAIDTEADLIVIRGDGAMANPLSMKIVPQQAELPTDAPQVAAR